MSSVSRAIVFQKHLDVTNELDGEFFLRALVSGKELIHRCFRQGDRFVLVVVEVGIMIVSRMGTYRSPTQSTAFSLASRAFQMTFGTKEDGMLLLCQPQRGGVCRK